MYSSSDTHKKILTLPFFLFAFFSFFFSFSSGSDLIKVLENARLSIREHNIIKYGTLIVMLTHNLFTKRFKNLDLSKFGIPRTAVSLSPKSKTKHKLLFSDFKDNFSEISIENNDFDSSLSAIFSPTYQFQCSLRSTKHFKPLQGKPEKKQ